MAEKRLVVIAYQINSKRGSEYSVAWNFLKYMSQIKSFELIFGTTGNHLGHLDESIEDYKSLFPNIKFTYKTPSSYALAINYLNRIGLLKPVFYLAYRRWLFEVSNYLKKNKDEIKHVHFLNPIGFREPGYLYDLGIPYTWGPIGGMNNPNKLLLNDIKINERIFWFLRRRINDVNSSNRRVGLTLKNATNVFTISKEMKAAFSKIVAREYIVLPENGMTMRPAPKSISRSQKYLELVWVGDSSKRKNLQLLLQACDKCTSNISLNIVGVSGENYSKKTHRLRYFGRVPRSEISRILKEGDLLVVTSLSEGNPTVIWEAYESSTPVLSLDHCGMSDTVIPESGWLLPISSSLASDLALALDQIAEDREDLVRKTDWIFNNAYDKFAWTNRISKFLTCYEG